MLASWIRIQMSKHNMFESHWCNFPSNTNMSNLNVSIMKSSPYIAKPCVQTWPHFQDKCIQTITQCLHQEVKCKCQNIICKRKDEQPKHRCCPLYSKSCCRLGQRGRTRVESLDGGAVNELLVGLREGDMTKGLETNRSKKTGCLSLVSLLIIIIQWYHYYSTVHAFIPNHTLCMFSVTYVNPVRAQIKRQHICPFLYSEYICATYINQVSCATIYTIGPAYCITIVLNCDWIKPCLYSRSYKYFVLIWCHVRSLLILTIT